MGKRKDILTPRFILHQLTADENGPLKRCRMDEAGSIAVSLLCLRSGLKEFDKPELVQSALKREEGLSVKHRVLPHLLSAVTDDEESVDSPSITVQRGKKIAPLGPAPSLPSGVAMMKQKQEWAFAPMQLPPGRPLPPAPRLPKGLMLN